MDADRDRRGGSPEDRASGRYRAVFDRMDEGACIVEVLFDSYDRPVDYRFVEVNAAFERHTGLRGAEGRTMRELDPRHEHHWLDLYGQVALTGVPAHRTERARFLGDRWFDVYAFPIGATSARTIAVLVSDVTDERRAQAALEQKEVTARRAREQAELLAMILATLEATRTAEGRSRRLTELLVPTLADHALVALPAGEGDTLVIRPGELDGTIVPGTPGDAADALLAVVGAHDQLAATLPLPTGGAGVLALARSDPDKPPFSPADTSVLRVLAGHAALLIGAAQIRTQELQLTARLQEALLPNTLPQPGAVRIAAGYRAAAAVAVGGDWYDAFVLPGGHVGLTVGDVGGHGIEAAASMGRLRTALAALAAAGDRPGVVLDRLNRFSAAQLDIEFATAVYAVLDPVSGVLDYASAGHPPALVVDPSGATNWLEEGRSYPISPLVAGSRLEDRALLEPGSLVVLYSDGLVERRDSDMADDMARLAHVAATHRGLPLEELTERLMSLAPSRHTDDVVVLCMRWTGTG